MSSVPELAVTVIDDLLALAAEARGKRRPIEWLCDELLDRRLEAGQ